MEIAKRAAGHTKVNRGFLSERERRGLDQRHGRDGEAGWLWEAGEHMVIYWMERERRAA